MRILAIRGCNLASLAGEFEIDLAHGPLAGAGVFAIVGNTGAGKSTLLDALCVALFERTPRLTNRSTVAIGRQDEDALGAQDVRTLLRRGAVHGWAEVDFEGSDLRRYRARWSVRRARNQPGGTLQDPQVKLTALDDGAALGGTRTETLRAIQARLGLSFDQFRRSALLAQGDFAAFLRADGRDRSELLERMTGTDIYTRLSIAAHQRATAAEQRLREARAGVEVIAVLDDDGRRRLDDDLAATRARQVVARAGLAEAEAAARWRDEAARWASEVDLATAAHQAAAAALVAADGDRRILEQRRWAEALRPAWVAVARGDAEVRTLHAAALAAAQDVATAEATTAAALAAQATLAARHAPLVEARRAAGLVERSASSAPPASVSPSIAAAAAWLHAHADLAPAIATHDELGRRFAQRRELAAAIAAHDQALATLAAAREGYVPRRAQLETERATLSGQLLEAQRHAASLHTRRGLSLDAAGRQEDQARRHQGEIAVLGEVAARARDAALEQAAVVEAEAALAGSIAAAQQTRGEVEAAHATARLLRDERARALASIRRAAGHTHERAELRAGEPCPLCGATAHPWRDRGALDDVVVAAVADLGAADAALDAARAQLAALDAVAVQRGDEQGRLRARGAALAATLAEATARWIATLAGFGELPLVTDPSTDAARALAATRQAAADRALEIARAARSAVVAAAKASQDAQAAVLARQSEVEQATLRVRELDDAIARLDLDRTHHAAARVRTASQAGEVDEALAAGLARWAAVSPEVARHTRRGPASFDDPALEPLLATLARTWRDHADAVAAGEAALGAELAIAAAAVHGGAIARVEAAARQAELAQRVAEATSAAGAAVTALADGCVAAELDAADLPALLAGDVDLGALAARLAALEGAAAEAATIAAERRRAALAHAERRPADLAAADARATRAVELEAAEAALAARAAAVVADDDARARRAAARGALAAAEAAALADLALGEVIGSHDGKLLRSFAQSLTLDALLAVANTHLDELAPRYQLARVPRHDLELQVVDRELGDEVRSVQSLSGGESFLVSLALALGLSSLAAHDVRVRTLLIDEGFGTLDPSTLDSALAVLDALQATGRQVGIISHIPALIERVGAHVRVVQRGAGRSEVVVSGRA